MSHKDFPSLPTEEIRGLYYTETREIGIFIRIEDVRLVRPSRSLNSNGPCRELIITPFRTPIYRFGGRKSILVTIK